MWISIFSLFTIQRKSGNNAPKRQRVNVRRSVNIEMRKRGVEKRSGYGVLNLVHNERKGLTDT
tara:strand:- start:69 stop:257 length:189 start_codon:yes stop_codon:yes gene_type:complete